MYFSVVCVERVMKLGRVRVKSRVWGRDRRRLGGLCFRPWQVNFEVQRQIFEVVHQGGAGIIVVIFVRKRGVMNKSKKDDKQKSKAKNGSPSTSTESRESATKRRPASGMAHVLVLESKDDGCRTAAAVAGGIRGGEVGMVGLTRTTTI